MGNYTPNPFMTQSIYNPTRLFATLTQNDIKYICEINSPNHSPFINV